MAIDENKQKALAANTGAKLKSNLVKGSIMRLGEDHGGCETISTGSLSLTSHSVRARSADGAYRRPRAGIFR